LNFIIVASYSFENIGGILSKKLVLHYLFSDPAELGKLKYVLNLTEEQVKEFKFVAKDETKRLYSLHSQIKDTIEFNRIVKKIIENSKNRVKQILGDQKYIQFIEWIEGE
jgi:DNA polymerase III delta prime subunit